MSDEKKFYENEEDARSESSQQTNNEDPLNTLRKIDKKEKMKKLKKMMYKLKDVQKIINIAKQESEEILTQMDFNKNDIKRIIDFIGEMSDVKLNSKEQRDIEENVRKWLSGEEEEEDEKNGSSKNIDDISVISYYDLMYRPNRYSTTTTWNDAVNLSCNDAGNTVLTDYDGNILNLE